MKNLLLNILALITLGSATDAYCANFNVKNVRFLTPFTMGQIRINNETSLQNLSFEVKSGWFGARELIFQLNGVKTKLKTDGNLYFGGLYDSEGYWSNDFSASEPFTMGAISVSTKKINESSSIVESNVEAPNGECIADHEGDNIGLMEIRIKYDIEKTIGLGQGNISISGQTVATFQYSTVSYRETNRESRTIACFL